MGVEVGQLPSSVTEERHGREAWGQRGLVQPPGAACWALPTTSLTCVTPTLGEKSGGWRSPAHRGVTTRRGHPGVGSLPTGQHGLLRQVPPGGVPADSGLIRSHTLPNQSSNPGIQGMVNTDVGPSTQRSLSHGRDVRALPRGPRRNMLPRLPARQPLTSSDGKHRVWLFGCLSGSTLSPVHCDSGNQAGNFFQSSAK